MWVDVWCRVRVLLISHLDLDLCPEKTYSESQNTETGTGTHSDRQNKCTFRHKLIHTGSNPKKSNSKSNPKSAHLPYTLLHQLLATVLLQ